MSKAYEQSGVDIHAGYEAVEECLVMFNVQCVKKYLVD